MGKKQDRSRVKKLASAVSDWYYSWGGRKNWDRSRETLQYMFGLTRDEANAVFHKIVEKERAPEWTQYSEESGGQWDINLLLKDFEETIEGAAESRGEM